MLSERASRYLQTWERRRHVEDLGLVREALGCAGVPITQQLLDFHEIFAGYSQRDGQDKIIFGLIHAGPKWLTPMEVEAFEEGEPPGTWYVACADAHPSYALKLDQFGVYYTTCCAPEASSFLMEMERGAFVWEFTSSRKTRYVQLSLYHETGDLYGLLLPSLEDCKIAELSDQFGDFYASEQMVVAASKRGVSGVQAWFADSAIPPEFAALRLKDKELNEPSSAVGLKRRGLAP